MFRRKIISFLIILIILLVLITATATGSGFVVPFFDSINNFSATSLAQQPEIETQLKPNLEIINIQTQTFEIKPETENIKQKNYVSVEKQTTPDKSSSECFALKENQKIPAAKQPIIEEVCLGPISTGGCVGLNCSGTQTIACSYCSSVNPSINHLSDCMPDSCPSGYFDQGVVCEPSGACNNCDGSNCDYDCAHQMLECTRTCTTNPCTDPDYPNYCDGYCWSDCSSAGYYGGKCCNGSWWCCPSSNYPELCCPSSEDPFYCTTENDTCLSNGCSINYPYKCNNKCWSCPAETNLCCPSNGDPSYCCGPGQICQSDGTCYTPQTTANLNGYLKDHYGNALSGTTIRLTDCSDNTKYSDATESNGYWEINATPDFYKLKTDMWWGTITWLIDGQECVSYSAQNYAFGNMQVNTETVNYGYLKDEYGNAWNNILVELTDCSDNTITFNTTDSSGYFYLKAFKGNYKFKTHMPWGLVEWLIGGQECPLFYWNTWNMETLTINSNTIVSGQVIGHQNIPLQGVQAVMKECSNLINYYDFTDSTGEFSFNIPKDNYKFQTAFNWGIITWLINGEECNLYAADNINLGTLPKIDTTIHGYFHDLENNPINGLLIELYDCSDNLIDSDTTNSSGFFSINNNAGEYQLKIVIQGYRIPLTNQEGNSCFVFFGDIDVGTIKVNPSLDCSVLNNSCYNENWRLFSCYFNASIPACVCYYEVCEFGCTSGQETCNAGQQETIKIDVDNINNNFEPLAGAKIYLDNEFKGITNSYGKKDVYAFPGFRNIKVFCPDNSFCSETGIYVNGTIWEYFDCGCEIQKGNIQVNVDNINGYPVANVYVFLDEDYSKSLGLTNPFGFTYIENIHYGEHKIDIRYKVTNPDYAGDYQVTQYINLNQPEQTVNFTAMVSPSNIISELNGSHDGNFSGEVIPLVAIALGIVDVASVSLSIEEYCKCINDADGDAFGGGYQACIDSIEECAGNTRNCINNIRNEAGSTAQKCWLEEILLAGDAISPFIPVGMVGHGAVFVGKSFKRVKIIDDIGKGIGKIGGDLWSFTKEGTGWFARWFDDLSIFKKAVNIGFDTTKWSDEAIEGLESFVKSSPDGQKAAKRIGKELGEEAIENISKNLQKLRAKGVKGVDRLEAEIVKHGKNLDDAKISGNQGEINGAITNLKGITFEAEVASHSRFIDNVDEVRITPTPTKPEIDVLLKNGDILEAKNISWSYLTEKQIEERIKNIVRQAGTLSNYNPGGNIKIVFKELPDAIKSRIENKLIAAHGSDILSKVSLEVL